jgi:hypothetical protein
MRSSMGGCVLNRFASRSPRSGFTIQRCAVAGPAGSGIRPDATASFSSAAASDPGACESCAPVASAWYSRAREIASWMSVAAIGSDHHDQQPETPPPRRARRTHAAEDRGPLRMFASEMTCQRRAMALMSVSRFFTCDSLGDTPRARRRSARAGCSVTAIKGVSSIDGILPPRRARGRAEGSGASLQSGRAPYIASTIRSGTSAAEIHRANTSAMTSPAAPKNARSTGEARSEDRAAVSSSTRWT